MIADVSTVIWKERKELFSQRGSRAQVIFSLLVPAVFFAFIVPWQEGSDWFHSPLTYAISIFLPILMVMLTIPESFAGERERHTLETLLASRLPDRAILFGKMAIPVALGWGTALLALFLGFIVANATHWSGQLMFYTSTVAIGNITLSLLMAVLSASAGVIISLRAGTVKQAQQILMAVTMFPLLLLGVAFTFVFTNKRMGDRIIEIMDNIDAKLLILIIAVVLILICWVLLSVAITRFQRSRLI